MNKPRSARQAAAQALFAVQEQGAWSEEALHRQLDAAALHGRDAALAARLTYGTLQNYAMCDFYLAHYVKGGLHKLEPRVHTLLRMGVYQLTMLARIPDHAAVGETVALVRRYAKGGARAAGLANGVLRAVARDQQADTLPRPDCPDKESYYALRYSQPEWFIRQLSARFGWKQAGQIAAANNEPAPLSVRVNRRKLPPEEAAERLRQDGFAVQPHPAMPHILLCTGGDIARHPLFTSGGVTVQDAASAACVEVLDPVPGSFVVDCCAAPGGKSFYIAERMDDQGAVLSCDIYPHKLQTIAQGAARLGLGSIRTRLADGRAAQEDLTGKADFVLCDAPCSGFGILRKKPEIRFKTDAQTAGLPGTQAAILQNAAQYVRPGGTLVYSTCTVLERENEGVVRAFLQHSPAFALEPFGHPVCGRTEGMVTLLPHLHHTDGFFIAKLRRKP